MNTLQYAMLVVGAFGLSPQPTYAQTMSNVGTPSSRAAQKLAVSAAAPISTDGTGIRFILNIRSNSGADLQLNAELALGRVVGWSAVTSTGGTCELRSSSLRGVPSKYEIREIRAGEEVTITSPTRPVIVTADFDCDSSVSAGDEVTIQVRLFARDPVGGPVFQADYVFERARVTKR